MLSHPGYFINIKLYIFYKILIHSNFKLGIQCLSLKRSLSFMLRKYFNIETLILIFIEKIHYSSCIIVISLIKALLCFLTSFHYFSINSFINKSSLMVLLSFF